MTHKNFSIQVLLLASSILYGASAMADDFAMMTCTIDSRGVLRASMLDTVDADASAAHRNPAASKLIGKRCATVVGRMLDAGFELVGRTPITMCERGPCPNPPPPPPPPPGPSGNPDCLIWDIAGDSPADPFGFALVSCNVSAPQGPTINMVQTERRSDSDLFTDAKGMSCTAFMSEVLASGGRILGRSVVPFETLTAQRPSRRPGAASRYERLDNSIVFEFAR